MINLYSLLASIVPRLAGNTSNWNGKVYCLMYLVQFFLLRCLWKRRQVVLEQIVVQAWQDLCFTPHRGGSRILVRGAQNCLKTGWFWQNLGDKGARAPVSTCAPIPMDVNPSAGHKPSIQGPKSTPPQGYATPHWCATPSPSLVHGDGGNEIPWP